MNLSDCSIESVGYSGILNLIKAKQIQHDELVYQNSLRGFDINIKKINGLKIIILNDNTKLGDKGIQGMFDILREDRILQEVQMNNCSLTNVSGISIVNLLKINRTIVKFDVDLNIISDDLKKLIKEAVLRNSQNV